VLDLLRHLPAFVKIATAFTAILVVYRLGAWLGVAIAVNAVILTLWAGAGGEGLLHVVKSLAAPENYLLFLVIMALELFSEGLRKTGKMEETVSALKTWVNDKRLILAGLPALIGLLPMPGGALFSAPLVESADDDKSLAPDHKVAINYWFRHLWEYWWPLYPGVILAIQYSGLSAPVFIALQLPFTVAAVVGGYFFILRKVHAHPRAGGRGRLSVTSALQLLLPIGIVVLSAMVSPHLFAMAGVRASLTSLWAMLAGLSAALIVVFWESPVAVVSSLKLFLDRKTWQMLAVVVGVQVFAGALTSQAGDATTLIAAMRDEFLHYGIPIVLMAMVIPFISGAVTGVAFGFVGASFPLVFALLGPHPSMGTVAAYTALAYGFGYAGMMLSPLHLCFVVSSQYFQARIHRVYRYITAPVVMIMAAAVAMAAVYYGVMR